MQKVILLISYLLMQGQSASVNQPKRELNGREIIGDEEFYFGTEQVGWHDAGALCEEAGMQLATLDTEERWNMIAEFVYDNADHSGYYWVGGHRQPAHSDNWHWRSSHADFTFSAWNQVEAQPDRSLDQEACLAILGKDMNGAQGLWWDFDCYTTGSIAYICENVPVTPAM